MRYTDENADVREVPAGEMWVGMIPNPRPHIAFATKLDDNEGELVVLSRFKPSQAFEMGCELIRLAAAIEAPNN